MFACVYCVWSVDSAPTARETHATAEGRDPLPAELLFAFLTGLVIVPSVIGILHPTSYNAIVVEAAVMIFIRNALSRGTPLRRHCNTF